MLVTIHQATKWSSRFALPAITAGLLVVSLPARAHEAQELTDVPQIARPQPFKTVPQALEEFGGQIRISTLPVPLEPTNPASPYSATPSATLGFNPDVPWVLTPDQKPWPLHYSEPSLPTRIVTSVPTVNELRLLLPGQVLDFIDRTRYAVNKYISDSLGASTQLRKRQLEQVQSWAKRVQEQKRLLPDADWPQYQFAKDTRDIASEFRQRVQEQSAPAVGRFIEEGQHLISKLTELMAVMPTHDMRKAAYDLMVRIQEGAELYQAQVQQEDAQILRALDDVLGFVPAQDTPSGRVPSRDLAPNGGGWTPEMAKAGSVSPISSASGRVQFENTSGLNGAPSRIERLPQRSMEPSEPRNALTAPTKPAQNSGTSLLIYLVIGVASLGIFGLVKKGRKKNGLK